MSDFAGLTISAVDFVAGLKLYREEFGEPAITRARLNAKREDNSVNTPPVKSALLGASRTSTATISSEDTTTPLAVGEAPKRAKTLEKSKVEQGTLW